MASELENAHLSNMLHRLEQQNERIQELAGGFNKAQLEWTPPEGGWGVGKILEHLVRSAEMYYDTVPAIIQKARSAGLVDKGDAWKRSMMGNWLLKALEAPRKVKTPKRFNPEQVEDRVVERLIEANTRIAGFMRDADGLDLNKVRVKSPVLGLIRYNLADCFAIIVIHSDRHLNRAEAITRMADFPATASV